MPADAAVGERPILLGYAAGMRESGGAADNPVADIFKTEIEAELAAAARHVAHGHVIVARQRERVARLKARGACTRDHELTLSVFSSTLATLEKHEHALRACAAKLTTPRRLLS